MCETARWSGIFLRFFVTDKKTYIIYTDFWRVTKQSKKMRSQKGMTKWRAKKTPKYITTTKAMPKTARTSRKFWDVWVKDGKTLWANL